MMTYQPDAGSLGTGSGNLEGFAQGTRVMTLKGAVPVETLVPGDRVVTRTGALSLRSIDRRVETRARLMRIAVSALGPDRPEGDVVVAADQPIVVRDWRAWALAGADHARIPAHQIADGECIRPEARRRAVLYALHFDVPAVIYAGGLELACEAARVPA